MKRFRVFGVVLALLFTLPTWAQKRPTAPRAATDYGYYHLKKANPQRISHYMREMGLTYLGEVHRNYEAATNYSIKLDDTDKIVRESSNETLDMFEKRIKINLQAPGDKDFLEVLKFTRSMGGLAGGEVGLCGGGQKPQQECDRDLAAYISCKNWMERSIDSGIFQDNWHEDCYGDWVEVHKRDGGS